jgi:hypothetical protein
VNLHELFQEHDMTIAWIRSRRLDRCRRDLADPSLWAQPIGAIGARWAVTGGARFSRVFRTAYDIHRASPGSGPASAAAPCTHRPASCTDRKDIPVTGGDTRPVGHTATVETTVEFISCPEPNCQVQAEIVDRFVLASTHGPVEHAQTVCLNGHVRTPLTAHLASTTCCSAPRDACRAF